MRVLPTLLHENSKKTDKKTEPGWFETHKKFTGLCWEAKKAPSMLFPMIMD